MVLFSGVLKDVSIKVPTTLQESSKNLSQHSEIKKSLAIILWLVFNKLSIYLQMNWIFAHQCGQQTRGD
jgi:hypothetical protein